MQPELLEAYGFILGADLPGSPIQCPAGRDQEQAEGLVIGIHPAGSPDKSICAQGVGAGVEQPGAVALMLGNGIDDERIDRAVPTRSASSSWLGIVVANPTTRSPSVAMSTRNAASGGRSIALRQASIMSASDTDASITSASSAGHCTAQERRWSSAMLGDSSGQARRTDAAIGSPEAAPTGAIVVGCSLSSRGCH